MLIVGIALFGLGHPGNHRYVAVQTESETSFVYIRSTLVTVVQKDSAAYKQIVAELSDYTAIFVYSLYNRYHLDIVNKAPANAVFVWFFGGGELLTTKKYWTSVMLPRTRLLYYKHRQLDFQDRAATWIKTNVNKYGKLLRQGQFSALAQPFRKQWASVGESAGSPLDTRLEKAIARMDYIAPVIPEDFDRLKSMVSCNAKLLSWSYATEFWLENMKDWRISGNNWLVGNAARYALNHIEMLRILRKVKGHHGKLITPLSYGDSTRYTRDVLRTGYKLYGEQFCPILEFMPIEKYHALICTCSAAFVNTPRQHAMGNILASMYLGARVFLRSENPAYHFLKRSGAVVFSIQTDIPQYAEAIEKPLDEECIQKNRDVVMKIASKEAFLDKTNATLDVLKTKASHII